MTQTHNNTGRVRAIAKRPDGDHVSRPWWYVETDVDPYFVFEKAISDQIESKYQQFLKDPTKNIVGYQLMQWSY